MANPNEVAIESLNKDSLLAEVEALNSDIAEVSKIKPFAEVDLAKTKVRLDALEANLKAIAEKEAKMAGLGLILQNIDKGCQDIAYYAELTAQLLAYIKDLDEKKEYDQAFADVESLRSRFLVLDYGKPLKSQTLVNEILGHEKACLYAHKGENAIAEGKVPLSEEELNAYSELSEKLGTSINGEKSRHYHLDKVIGFRYDEATKRFDENVNSQEDFLNIVAEEGRLNQVGIELSELTQSRKDAFTSLVLKSYNKLASAAFEGDDYQDALFYYEHREFVDMEAINEESYRLPNESEFHFAYLLNACEKKSDDDFYEYTKSLHDALILEDEFTIDLMGHMLASEKISEGHFELLLAELKKTNFEVEVLCFGNAVTHGLSEERQFSLMNILVHEKKQRGDIEKMGKPLYTIRANLAESQAAEFKTLIRDLLRSPHAKRAVSKSGSPYVHALNGEDFDKPVMPLGKREKNTKIKSWDFITKGLYFGLDVFLPIALCIAAYPVLMNIQAPELLKRLINMAPLALGVIIGMLAINARYGMDERGSEVWGRVLGIVGILACGTALAYFIIPAELNFLAPYGYSILGLGAMLGIASLLLKQRKTAVRIVLTFPLTAIIVASAVFIVIDLMNGKI